jgi:hypothetical protein
VDDISGSSLAGLSPVTMPSEMLVEGCSVENLKILTEATFSTFPSGGEASLKPGIWADQMKLRVNCAVGYQIAKDIHQREGVDGRLEFTCSREEGGWPTVADGSYGAGLILGICEERPCKHSKVPGVDDIFSTNRFAPGVSYHIVGEETGETLSRESWQFPCEDDYTYGVTFHCILGLWQTDASSLAAIADYCRKNCGAKIPLRGEIWSYREGQLDPRKTDRYVFGTVADQSCDSGFSTRNYCYRRTEKCGGETEGLWQVQTEDPNCLCRKNCRDKTPATGERWADFNNNPGYSPLSASDYRHIQGTTVKQSCQGGYSLRGTARELKCDDEESNGDGRWLLLSGDGSCQRNCDPMVTATGEIWSYSSNSLPPERKVLGNSGSEYIFDTLTTLSCSVGYGLNGLARIKKCNSGSWDSHSNSGTSCIKVCSGDPPSLVAGGYLRESGKLIARTGSFYRADGSSIAATTDIVNGSYNAAVDATVDGKCNAAEYNENGDYRYSCRADGWQLSGGCTEKPCSHSDSKLSNNFLLDNGTSGSTLSQNTADFNCKTGYSFGINVAGSMKMYCLKGVWSKNSGESKTCYKNCSATTVLAGESWSYQSAGTVEKASNTYEYKKGTVATQGCSDGYSLIGTAKTRTCIDSSGTPIWQENSGTGVCRRNCSGNSTSGGSWSYSDSSTKKHGSTATLTCSSGYSISDSTKKTLTCDNGSWGTLAICNPNPCPNNASLISSSHHATTTTGTTASGSTKAFTCQRGYSGSGADGGNNNGTVKLKCFTESWSLESGECCQNSAATYTSVNTVSITLPNCVSQAVLQAWGGKGGDGSGDGIGGLGGYTVGLYTPGTRSGTIRIGGGGAAAICTKGTGGAGGNYGAVVNSSGQVLVTAGGGGGASSSDDAGGYGGGNNSAGGDGSGKQYGYGGNSSNTSMGCVTDGTCGKSDGMTGGSAIAESASGKYCGGAGGGGVYGGGAGSWGSGNHSGGGGGGGFCNTGNGMSGCSGISSLSQTAKVRVLQGRCTGYTTISKDGAESYSTNVTIPACASRVFLELWGGKGKGTKGGLGGYSYGTYTAMGTSQILYLKVDYGGAKAACGSSHGYSYNGGNAVVVATSSSFETNSLLLVAGGGGGSSEGSKDAGGYGGGGNSAGGNGGGKEYGFGGSGNDSSAGNASKGCVSGGSCGRANGLYGGNAIAESKGGVWCGGGGGGGYYGGGAGSWGENNHSGGGGGGGYCNTSIMTDCGGSSGVNYTDNVYAIISWY